MSPFRTANDKKGTTLGFFKEATFFLVASFSNERMAVKQPLLGKITKVSCIIPLKVIWQKYKDARHTHTDVYRKSNTHRSTKASNPSNMDTLCTVQFFF